MLEATLPASRVQELRRQLPGLTGGEGVIDSEFAGYQPVTGEPPSGSGSRPTRATWWSTSRTSGGDDGIRAVAFSPVSGSALATVLAVAAGLAGSIQVALMSRLGERIGVVEALAFSTALTAAIAFVILVLARGSVAGFERARPPAVVDGSSAA